MCLAAEIVLPPLTELVFCFIKNISAETKQQPGRHALFPSALQKHGWLTFNTRPDVHTFKGRHCCWSAVSFFSIFGRSVKSIGLSP